MRQLVVAVFVAVVLGASPARAAVIAFETVLAPEIAGSSGSGSALVTFDTTAHTLNVSFSFSNLTGTTTVAHIHCCVPTPGTGTIGVATYPGTFPGFPTGLTSGSYSSPTPIDLTLASSYTGGALGFLTIAGGGTPAGAEAALLQGLLTGRAYLNVHTNFAPGGEIRGFLAAVPEPATCVLIGLAVAAVAARGRRVRRARDR